MEEKGSVVPQIVAAFGATLGAFSLGTVLGWPAPAQVYLQADTETGKCNEDIDFDCLNKDDWSQVAALMNIGAATVPILTVFLFPIIGKKWTMISLVFPFIGGWVLLLFSTQAWMFFVGRLLTGFSGGAFAIAAPSYSNEIAEPKIRGALGSLMQLMVCLGILFMFVAGKLNWQVLTGICIIFPTILGIWMFFMPRSPAFLIQKNNIEGARKSLQFLRKKKNVEDELSQLQDENVERQKLGTISPVTLLSNKVYLKPFLISLMLMAFQQFSGINFVISYTVQIFKDAGSDVDENLSTILVGLVQVLGTAFAITIVDRFGRKILLTVSALLMCLATCALGVFFLLKQSVDEETTTTPTMTTTPSMTTTLAPGTTTAAFTEFVSKETIDNLGILPLISLMVFIAGFSVGFGPLPWVMNVELFSAEARVPAAAACGSFNWLCSYLVVSTVPSIQNATSAAFCYFLFSGISLLATLFVIFITPETKGKSEEDMKNHFRGKN